MKKGILIIVGIVVIVLIAFFAMKGTKKEPQVSVVDSSVETTSVNIQISDLKTVPVDGDSSIVSWKTSVSAASELYYTTTPPATTTSWMVVKDPTPGKAHAIELSNLLPAKKYYISVVAIDPATAKKTTVMGEFVTQK